MHKNYVSLFPLYIYTIKEDLLLLNSPGWLLGGMLHWLEQMKRSSEFRLSCFRQTKTLLIGHQPYFYLSVPDGTPDHSSGRKKSFGKTATTLQENQLPLQSGSMVLLTFRESVWILNHHIFNETNSLILATKLPFMIHFEHFLLPWLMTEVQI